MRTGLVTPWARRDLGAAGLAEVRAAEPTDAHASILAAGRGFQASMYRGDTASMATAKTAIDAFRTAQRNLLDELAGRAA